MPLPEHRPWKGPLYESASLRLLLLGKAHYHVAPREDSADFTNQLIQRVRDRVIHEPFFTKTLELVAPLLPTAGHSAADFWNCVAFANYIPVTVGPGVHDAPTGAMWTRAGSRLIELLESLAPTHVLSLGKEQWNNISLSPEWTCTEIEATSQGSIRLWKSRTRSVVATPIAHPTASYGFRTPDWVEHVRRFLDIAVAAPLPSYER